MWPDFPFVPTDTITCREDFGKLLNLRGLTGTVVEIGTHRGEFASHLLRHWNGRQLVCVDPWQDGLPGYDDIEILPTRLREPDYRETVRRLSIYGRRARIMRMLSADAAQAFGAGSLDGVYIDANHKTEAFREDVHLWGWRLRSSGWMAGHDFTGDWAEHTKPVLFDLLLTWRQPIFYVLGDAASWFTFKP